MSEERIEKNNRRKGWVFSVVFHTILVVLLAIFGLSWQSPPPEPGGILVNLGVPDVGQGEENAPQGDPAPPVEAPEPEPEPEPVKETAPPPPPKKETKPTPTPKKEVKKTEDPREAALRKKKEEERKKQEVEDRKQREKERKEAEAERKKKAAEEKARKEAAAKAAAKKAEEDRKKKELEALVSGGLGGGSGSGKGNTGKPGNQGDPNGDPNADNLSGISTGAGTVGGGLSGRGYKRPSPPKDNSQHTGVVVVYVCVDKRGNVISAEYTQAGSTTADSNLKRIAISNAKKYKFDSGSISKQCGTIRYDFKVK